MCLVMVLSVGAIRLMERRYEKALLRADQSVHQVGKSFCSYDESSFLIDNFIIDVITPINHLAYNIAIYLYNIYEIFFYVVHSPRSRYLRL